MRQEGVIIKTLLLGAIFCNMAARVARIRDGKVKIRKELVKIHTITNF